MTTATTLAASLSDVTQSCRRAQRAWFGLSVRERLRPVSALRRRLVAECDALCAAVARDIGKPIDETLGTEVLPLADACRFLEKEAARLLRPRHVPLRLRPLWLWGQRDVVAHRPRGLIGLIGTWNYPLFLNGAALIQALTAGNGVVWKPSELAPQTAESLYRFLGDAGYPDGLVQLLPATRAAGAELADADIDHVVFTGSSSTGRTLAAHLGRRLIPSTLELSGCDALFVLDDADLGLAARAAWFGATLNRGQTCLGVRRVFVPRPLCAAFAEHLRPLLASARPVRLALAAQAEHAERVVQEAVADGAHVLETPARGSTEAFAPAIVLDARPDMAICREATFAPVMAVLPYENVEDAVRMDGACGHALGASIFTRNPRRGEELAARLRSGSVAINDVIVPTAHPATPFGGTGQSGWGVTRGAEGLLDLTVPQVVSVRGGRFRPHYDMANGATANQGALVRGLLDFSHGPTLLRRWRGLRQVVRAFLHRD